MIQVAIVGSGPAIGRHMHALGKIQDIRMAGCWISGGMQEFAVEMASGISTSEPNRILENADVLILADAGSFCNKLAVAALRKARHVFLYPSLLRSVNEAHQLIKLSNEANVVLKCGHTGSNCIIGLLKALPDADTIKMVELRHYMKLNPNSKPGSISDALLGDVEIINSLIHARITSIKAKGLSMLSAEPEIINARLEFDNGCAVNYNCNLVAAQNEFVITLVVKNKFLKYNFITNEFTGWYLQRTMNQNENPIFIESIQVERSDLLLAELTDFMSLIRSGSAYLTLNDAGFESYVLTNRMLEIVMKTLVQCA
jgi:predicted dehydrogenase